MVRCGKCNVIFNGNENIKRLRSEGAAHVPATPKETAAPDRSKSAIARKQKSKAEMARALKSPAPAGGPQRPRGEDPKAEQSAPEDTMRPEVQYYLDPPDHPPRGRRGILYGGILLLALGPLLTAGYAYYYRERLANYPLLVNWIRKACEYVACEMRPRRDVEHIQIIKRSVHTHPARPDALMITATLVNKAPFPQPYPLMQVSFTNLQGTIVAAHRFKPEEYLMRRPDPAALMTPDAPVRASVQVPDPGVNATAFEFALF